MVRMLNQKRIIIHLILLLIYILGLMNFFFPVIRLQYQVANQIFGLLLLFIPWVLVVNGFFFRRMLVKIINVVILIIPCLIALPYAFLITFMSSQGAFMPIHHLNLESFSVMAYRTNGGATTDFGVVVRQEKEIVPGVLLVKQFYSKNHQADILIKRLNDSVIEIDGKRIVLKRNVYIN